MRYNKTVVSFNDDQNYASYRNRQPGCKNVCSHEYHLSLNQVWRVRNLNPDKRVLYCRECEYATIYNQKRCYCCGAPMAYTHARLSVRRKINNEKKIRY
jgi:hypothetical protein